MSVLVLAAHPDDEVLGCGGTIARLTAAGTGVAIAILGEGVTSRYAARGDADTNQLAALQGNSRRAADILGVSKLFTFGLPDNRFDSIPLLDVVKVIEKLIADLRPEVVYTQHGGDLNIDHAVLFRATLTATRPMAETPVRAVYAYEVASSSEWAFGQFAPRFLPNLFVNIEATLETKVAAMQVYESEARLFPHPRSPDALLAQARRWGATVGVAAAEAFQVVREIR